MRRPPLSRAVLGLFLLPLLASCRDDNALEARVEALQARVDALEARTVAFSDLTGTASDAQIPDDVTIAFAQTAGDADTLDGFHANEIAESGSFTPVVSGTAFGWAPEGPFSYLRTGDRVRVTGSLRVDFFPNLTFDFIDLLGLPYRAVAFASSTDVIGTCSADLLAGATPVPVTCSLDAVVGAAGVRVSFTSLGGIFYDVGTVAVDFSYTIDP